jgi:uracil DNA glycosylase
MIDYKQYIEHVRYVAEAHQAKVLPTAKAYRLFPSGEKNQYFTHSLWCSTMLLLETQLPESLRDDGAVALLFHDVLEDTSAPLPKSLSPESVRLIKDMTYKNFQDEVAGTLAKDSAVQLMKLYDKVATLYDGSLRSFRYPEWLDFTEKLITNVERKYGQLNIVILGKELVKKYRAMLAEGTIPKLSSEIS